MLKVLKAIKLPLLVTGMSDKLVFVLGDMLPKVKGLLGHDLYLSAKEQQLQKTEEIPSFNQEPSFSSVPKSVPISSNYSH